MSSKKNIIWYFNNYLFNKYRGQAKRLIRHSEVWSVTEIQNYQFNCLKHLLNYAYQKVPYYNELFKKINFDPEHFENINDIRKIPLLTKEIIRENTDKLFAKDFPDKYLIKDSSGGTTGVTLAFYADKRFFSPVEWIYIKNLWKRAGYSFYDPYVIFRGEVLPQKKIDTQKYWRYDALRNSLIFSSFMMDEEMMDIYLKKINSFKPKFIHAYPSVLTIFADYIKRHKIGSMPFLKGIFLGSETLYSWQRELFQETFNARIYSWYGHRERCILAGEDKLPSVYEVYPTYGFAELLNNDGRWCSEDGEIGELVGTSFNNYAFPLIRYQTHDIAEYSLERSSSRNYMRIKNIKGRLQDFFIDKKGSLITFSTSYRALDPIKDKITAHQYIQNEPGKLILNIEPKTILSENDLKLVHKSFIDRYPKFDITIKTIKEIPRAKSGKFRYFIQNLDIKFNKYKMEG